MKKSFFCITVLIVSLLYQGCSTESFKRTLYDMFQSYGEQQCQQDPNATCEGQNYEEYQRERDAQQTHKDRE